MRKIGEKKCRTQYFTEQNEDYHGLSDLVSKGERAKQKLHELSALDNEQQIHDPMSNWVKFNQASLKLYDSQRKGGQQIFDDTLHQLRKNTTLIPKKELNLRNKKCVRDPYFMKKVKNEPQRCDKNITFNSVNLKLNFLGRKNNQRIHSNSVKLDPHAKVKTENRKQIIIQDVYFPKKNQKEKEKQRQRICKIRQKLFRSKKKSGKMGSSILLQNNYPNQIPENNSQRIFPLNIAHIRKFQTRIQNLRQYERENILSINTSYQYPQTMKGTRVRSTRFSTYA